MLQCCTSAVLHSLILMFLLYYIYTLMYVCIYIYIYIYIPIIVKSSPLITVVYNMIISGSGNQPLLLV